jgi:hypothetical protein
MPAIYGEKRRFGPDAMETIEAANEIIAEYSAAGLRLTIRQLYYQFVSRDLIPNTERSYKRLIDVMNDARMAGLVDWDAIEDRTRNLKKLPVWGSPQDLVDAAAQQFRYDLWESQEYRLEVWIEKDALTGVIEGICNELRVPYFAARGYCSASEMWAAAHNRFMGYLRAGQRVRVLYLGDHDPSGLDMSRDVADRIRTFMMHDAVYDAIEAETIDREDRTAIGRVAVEARDRFELERLALNIGQVRQYNPPPNPAKVTDSRAKGYIDAYGRESWELDALEPRVLRDLVRRAVLEVRDDELFEEAAYRERQARRLLSAAATRWDEVSALLNGSGE